MIEQNSAAGYYGPAQRAYLEAKAKYDLITASRAYELAMELFVEGIQARTEASRGMYNVLMECSDKILKECGYNAAFSELRSAEHEMIAWAREEMRRHPSFKKRYDELFANGWKYTHAERVGASLKLNSTNTNLERRAPNLSSLVLAPNNREEQRHDG